MEFEQITPQRALLDLETMHKYLQKNLTKIVQISDLVPYFEQLQPINVLKEQLSLLLQKQYESQLALQSKKKKANKIRKLFMSLHYLSGIPSDDIHAKILSFLPASEFKKLPILSTHFRDVLMNYPSIYNRKLYHLDLMFEGDYSNKEKHVTNHVHIIIEHINKKARIMPMAAADSPCGTPQKLQNIAFPFRNISYWVIQSPQVWGFGGVIISSKTNALTIPCFNDKLLDLIHESSDNVKVLILSSITSENTISKIVTKQMSFKQCIAISYHNSKFFMLQFNKLEYIELLSTGFENHAKQDIIGIMGATMADEDEYKVSTLLDNDRDKIIKFYIEIYKSKLYTQNVNKILELSKRTLHCFVCHESFTSQDSIIRQKEYENVLDPRNYLGVLHIPEHVQWLSIKKLDYIIDLSECNDLIAIELSQEMRYEQVIWQKLNNDMNNDNNQLIPFMYLLPNVGYHASEMGSYWKPIITRNSFSQLPPVKFCSIGKRPDSWNVIDDDVNHYDNGLDTYTVDQVMCNKDKYNERRCLLLDPNEMNRSLFDKLMKFKYPKQRDIEYKQSLEMYRNWWKLNFGFWIKNIGIRQKWVDLNYLMLERVENVTEIKDVHRIDEVD